MKRLLVATLFLLPSFGGAHDEGHGPKLSDQPKQGGKVAPVIAAADASRGAKASLIYKSEIVKNEDGTIKVFLYDSKMNPLPEAHLGNFGKTAKATVEHIKRDKIVKKTEFPLELKEGVFQGNLGEKPKTPTFNVDVKMTEGKKELLAAFDGLETSN